MEQHSAYSRAEWSAAVRGCASTRSLHVIREEAVLVFVASGAVFHPLHALLPLQPHGTQQRQPPFIAVMRLHAQVTAVLRALQASGQADACAALVENLVFVDRAVDVVSAKRAADADGAVAVPFFQPREVNLSGGALCSFAASEADAKAALSDIAMAVQSLEALDFLLDDEDLVVIVEHDEGYIGQQFDRHIISKIIRVKETPFKPSERSLDDVLESYEEDYRDLMEINGVAEQPQSLAVKVQTGFTIRVNTSSISALSSAENSIAHLLSSWSGIENIRSLHCKPPPNSPSMVCFSAACGESDCGVGSSLPRSSTKSNDPFSTQVRHTIRFLRQLESSATDSTYEWPSDARSSGMDMDETEHSYLSRKFRSFLTDPDAAHDDTIDGNNTTELDISLNFERDEEQLKHRTDLDFLEKMWEFFRAHVVSPDAAVLLVQEFLVTFATARVIPLVHPANPTRLGAFLKGRVEACRGAGDPDGSSTLQHLQSELANPHTALASLFELGEWKLQRDIASWFAQIGFTVAESKLILDQLQLQQKSHDRTHKDLHAAAQHLIDVCSLAVPLGMSGSLLRKLANDCLRCFTHQKTHSAEGIPTVVALLNSFIPERVRSSLADPMFWDLDMSFGGFMERKIRICEASFHHKCSSSTIAENADAGATLQSQQHALPLTLDSKTIRRLHRRLPEAALLHPAVLAFVQHAEKSVEANLPPSLELVQYECTARTLEYTTR